jgi:hypothetical protein
MNLKYSRIISIYNLGLSEVQVYPNPFSGTATILVPENIKEEILLEIYDLPGKRLIQQKRIPSEGKTELTPFLPAGTYFLKVSVNNQVKTFKLVSE